MMNKRWLYGKVVVLIDGGQRGAELAVLLAGQGANVALAYERDWRQTAVMTRQQIQAIGQQCLLVGLQQIDSDVINRVIEYAIQIFGKMDIFIDLRVMS